MKLPTPPRLMTLCAILLVTSAARADGPTVDASPKFLIFTVADKPVGVNVSFSRPGSKLPTADSPDYKRIASVIEGLVKQYGSRVAITTVYPDLGDGKIGYVFRFEDGKTAARDLADLIAGKGLAKDDTIAGVIAGGYGMPSGLGIDQIAALAGQSELRELRLWGTDFGDGVRQLAKMTRLEILELCQCKASDGRLEFLGALTGLRNVRLDGFPLDPKTLGALARLKALEILCLDDTPFDDLAAAALKDLVDLRVLNLNNTKVTDAGTVHWRKLVKLELLGLNNTAVTDKTLEVVQNATELASLGLNDTKITGAGLKHLGRMPKLFSFGIANTPLDAEELIRNAREVSGSGRVMINTRGTKMTPEQMKRYADLRQYSEFFTPDGKLIEHRPKLTPPPAKTPPLKD